FGAESVEVDQRVVEGLVKGAELDQVSGDRLRGRQRLALVAHLRRRIVQARSAEERQQRVVVKSLLRRGGRTIVSGDRRLRIWRMLSEGRAAAAGGGDSAGGAG